MKKMRKYSASTGLKAVPSIPSTFVARSSPHFMAALSAKPGQDHRKTSVYKTFASSPNPPRKHSTILRTNLPMIHVTMDGMEERSGNSGSPQRKVSSSNGPHWARGGFNAVDKNEKFSSSSNATERQRKISVKKGASVLGETPLGRDLIFRRKISNTNTPPKKANKAEEKEKLLMKYSLLDNAKLNNDSKKRMKTTYFSRYNIETSPLPKGNLDSNWTARGRTQSLNFVPKSEGTSIKEKTTDKIFTSRTFPGESTTHHVFARDRAQSLNLVLRGSGSGKTRALNERQRDLYEIMEEKRKQTPPAITVSAKSNLQAEPVVKTNQLQGSLFLYSQKEDYKLDNKLSPTRENVHTAPYRKDSQDRSAFLTFPSLRAKTWTD
ncbi:hypothetical protein ACROYT_G007812 [Oculina patagonica]